MISRLVGVNSAEKKLLVYGIDLQSPFERVAAETETLSARNEGEHGRGGSADRTRSTFVKLLNASVIIILVVSFRLSVVRGFAQEIKQPNVAGTFYPDNQQELSSLIDDLLKKANPQSSQGSIFALIEPHAGYGFSGQAAAFGYKLIKGRSYKTVVVIGPAHHYGFIGASVYPEGIFRTPLGDLEIDSDFAKKLLYKDSQISFDPLAFEKEHSIEVQLPFLQKVLSDFRIVPIITGDCPLATCKKIAQMLKEAIGQRQDVLVIASSDMYHGYDYQEAGIIDALTLSYLKNMDAEGLYYGLREAKLQLCGGFAVVTTLLLAKEMGHDSLSVLNYTDSTQITGKKTKGIWTVGYSSSAIDQQKGEQLMLNEKQKKRLLEIARNSIRMYLKTGKKIEVSETDSQLMQKVGAFVSLHKSGELRGCIGNLAGKQPLCLTIRDMAIESAVGDPRFEPLRLDDLDTIEIEISVLSALERIDSPDKIQLGRHGVMVKNGFNSGVFLPQVAVETGWTKEEFLSYLCVHKAGLSSDAWKDKTTEICIFTADVFSEKEILSSE